MGRYWKFDTYGLTEHEVIKFLTVEVLPSVKPLFNPHQLGHNIDRRIAVVSRFIPLSYMMSSSECMMFAGRIILFCIT